MSEPTEASAEVEDVVEPEPAPGTRQSKRPARRTARAPALRRKRLFDAALQDSILRGYDTRKISTMVGLHRKTVDAHVRELKKNAEGLAELGTVLPESLLEMLHGCDVQIRLLLAYVQADLENHELMALHSPFQKTQMLQALIIGTGILHQNYRLAAGKSTANMSVWSQIKDRAIEKAEQEAMQDEGQDEEAVENQQVADPVSDKSLSVNS